MAASERAIRLSSQFKRDLKKRYLLLASPECAEVLHLLVRAKALPAKYRDHQLTGSLNHYRECHLKPDLLLMYTQHDKELHLARLGSHAEIFK